MLRQIVLRLSPGSQSRKPEAQEAGPSEAQPRTCPEP